MAIIGISGKKQHGKDTIGKIIQYLIYNEDLIYNEGAKEKVKIDKAIINLEAVNSKGLQELSGWEIKHFADPLKNIVCTILGCTREQLEDNTFKETLLGEEWSYYYNSFLDTEINRRKIITVEEYDSMTETIKNSYIKAVYTPRTLLQYIGTDCGRQIIHPNIWVNALMGEYKSMGYMMGFTGHGSGPIFPDWIVTDVRFPNEAQAIKDREGFLIRVNRDTRYFLCDHCHAEDIKACELIKDDTCPRCNYYSESNLTMVIPDQDAHESETALDNYDNWDAVLDNDKDIEYLIDGVRTILQQFKII